MHAGIVVEVRCPLGSVAFSAEVPISDINTRMVRRELLPGERVTVNVGIPVGRLALIAGQTKFASVVDVDGEQTVLEGQDSTDFGLLWCVRGSEEFGDAPFPESYDLDTVVREISVTNTSAKKNPLFLMVSEQKTEPVIDKSALPAEVPGK